MATVKMLCRKPVKNVVPVLAGWIFSPRTLVLTVALDITDVDVVDMLLGCCWCGCCVNVCCEVPVGEVTGVTLKRNKDGFIVDLL